ncbi:hypothetical protein GCM10027447_03970 [Glycomyces halotolerans]
MPPAESLGPKIVRPVGVNSAGYVLLVDGAVPEPARRGPETYPGRGAAPSADPERLERVLR